MCRPGRLRSARRGEKRALTAVLDDSTSFRSAQELFTELRSRGENIGLTTVYSRLRVLAEAGEVDALRSEDGEIRYRRCSTDHHHHLVCQECGRSVEVEGPEVERWARRSCRLPRLHQSQPYRRDLRDLRRLQSSAVCPPDAAPAPGGGSKGHGADELPLTAVHCSFASRVSSHSSSSRVIGALMAMTLPCTPSSQYRPERCVRVIPGTFSARRRTASCRTRSDVIVGLASRLPATPSPSATPPGDLSADRRRWCAPVT